MRLNESIRLIGEKIVLVPYESRHVPRYHEWMSDEKIRELTASEPLTIEEEYEMQKTWRDDDDKLTFIVLNRQMYEELGEIPAMIGDVNLFIYDEGAELEVMIAEESARGKGMGKEAVTMMIGYALSSLSSDLQFTAKIGYDNTSSLGMFESKFGFERESSSEVFREHTLRMPNEKRDAFQEAFSRVRTEKI